MDENEELDYETLENTIDLGEIDETEEAEIDEREKNLAKKREQEKDVTYPLERNNIDRSKFDLKDNQPERKEVTEADIQELYDSLEVDLLDENVRATALFVRSLTPFSVYELERVFVEYNPIRCALLDADSGVVRFKSAFEAAEALILATKRLVRIRQVDQQEEGEVDDDEDEDEEGNVIRKENDEKVLVIKNPEHTSSSSVIELDVTKVKIPSGVWRFVTEHVPKNRYMFARLATGFELRTAMLNPYKKEISDDRPQASREEEYESKDDYRRKRLRPGLNVFDEKGRELDWDYEHDTRFYDDKPDEPESKKIKGPEEIELKGGEKVRSRGRGTKKFVAALLEDSD